MTDLRFWSIERSAGFVLVLGFVIFFVGACMYWIRWRQSGIRGGPPPSYTYLIWERSIIMAAVVLTAIGFVLLEAPLQNTDGLVLARTGASAYFFAAILWVVAEALDLTRTEQSFYPLIVIYVILAYLAEAAIGGSLLQSSLLAAWVGWATIIWNLGWLVAGLITRLSFWIPMLHHVMPLVIGITLLSQTA